MGLSEMKADRERLQNAFDTLANNHQQLIKFKDEYKERCTVLGYENKTLQERLEVSQQEGRERDTMARKVQQLHSLVADYERKCEDLIKKHEFQVDRLRGEMAGLELEQRTRQAEFKRALGQADNRARELVDRMRENEANVERLRRDDLNKIEELRREKKEMNAACQRVLDVSLKYFNSMYS